MIMANPFHLEELIEDIVRVSRDGDWEGGADGEGRRQGGGGAVARAAQSTTSDSAPILAELSPTVSYNTRSSWPEHPVRKYIKITTTILKLGFML